MVVYLVNHLLYILSKLSKQNLSISEQKRDIVIFYVVYLVNHLLYILSKLSKQNLSISEQKRDIVIFYVNKRIRSIEKFMNGLLIHPLIKNSQILFDFLSIQNNKKF